MREQFLRAVTGAQGQVMFIVVVFLVQPLFKPIFSHMTLFKKVSFAFNMLLEQQFCVSYSENYH
jgi:hypothetical protein